jgi:sulfur-oxidizing protein SoxY
MTIIKHLHDRNSLIARRSFLVRLAALAGLASTAGEFLLPGAAWGQAAPTGLPLPDEPVEATLKRLFGDRKVSSGEGKIKLELPLIAEDGGNVLITVDASMPISGEPHLSHLYIISDKNRRPMLAKFSFTPQSGKAFISTSIRLATTTDVRAVAEMSDGTLYAVSKNVRVTISGCDLPPAG